MMRRRSEEGKGTLSNIIWLLVAALGIYAGMNVCPVYFSHYMLKDKMDNMCKLGRSPGVDDKIKTDLMKTVREEELLPYISQADFVITTNEGNRRIIVEYDRTVKFLPGLSPHKIHFRAQSDGIPAY
jgi:hypothetical protein